MTPSARNDTLWWDGPDTSRARAACGSSGRALSSPRNRARTAPRGRASRRAPLAGRRCLRVVAEWSAGVLNVCAEQVRDVWLRVNRASRSMLTANAGGIADVETARVERVASEEHAGATIVDGDARRLVTRDRRYVQDPAPQVDRGSVLGPARDLEERTHRCAIATDDGRCRPSTNWLSPATWSPCA